MKLDYYKYLGRKLAIVSIVCLSSLGAMTYQGEVLAGAHGGGHGNGGHGNGGVGNGKGQGAGNSLGDRSDLIGAMNASDKAREHAAHESAVVHADPAHILAFPDHYIDGVHIR